jgi:hypothetical protein
MVNTRLSAVFVGVLAFEAYAFSVPVIRQTDLKVTLTVPAQSVKSALDRLSAELHVPLAASPETAADVVCFRLKDVPFQEALKRIAEAVDASWQPAGSGYRLVRSSEQLRAEKTRETSADVERFRGEIQRATAGLQNLAPWSSGTAERLAVAAESFLKSNDPQGGDIRASAAAYDLTQKTPLGRVVKELAQAMDPRDLVDLPAFYRTVWSSNPTSMQRPFSRDTWQVVENFLKDQAEWNAAVERHGLSDAASLSRGYSTGRVFDWQNMSPHTVSTVLLSASKVTPSGSVMLEFAAYDKAGRRLGQSQLSLSEFYGEYAQNGKKTDGSASPPEQLISFGPDAKYLVASSSGHRAEADAWPKELRDRVAAPEECDPLALFVSPALIHAAEMKGVNMVASLPDTSISVAAMGNAADVRFDQLLGRLAYFQTSAELKDGWLMVRPMRPSESRIHRADRAVLGKWLRGLASGTPVTLDEEASVALSLPDPRINLLPHFMSGLFHQRPGGEPNPDLLRLYGMLTPEQRQRMTGSGLELGRLTNAELVFVNRLLYGPGTILQFKAPSSEELKSGELPPKMALFNNGLLREATEALPSGIPTEGVLRLKLSSSQVAKGNMQGAREGHGQMLTPRSLAWQRFSQERTDLFPTATQPGRQVDLTNLQIGWQSNLTFTFAFTPMLSMVFGMDGSVGRDFETVTLDSLPDNFKKQFDDAYQGFVRMYANARPGELGIPQGLVLPP